MTFILPGTPAPKKDPYAAADRAWEEAKAARLLRRAADKQRSWDNAVKQVNTWTPSMAVEAMTRMPQGIQQQYLLAEESGLNRSEVLRFFPAVAPSTREAWAGVASPSPTKPASTRGKRSTTK